MGKRNVLVTGRPGIGKSTVIEKLLRKLGLPAVGFFTREMRAYGKRVGFSIQTCNGGEGVLAHVDIKGADRVGRYGVDLEAVERLAVPSIAPETSEHIIVIDEIGKMECLSKLFRNAVMKALDAENRVIGSIALKGDAFVQSVKARSDVLLVEITEKNRNTIIPLLLRELA